jgi:hypothetical protein
MTDAELQALDVGTIVYNVDLAQIRKFIWDGDTEFFKHPDDQALVYELCSPDDVAQAMGFCTRACDLHKTAEEAIEAIMSADKSGWPLAQRALAEVLREYRHGIACGDVVYSIGDEFMRGFQS